MRTKTNIVLFILIMLLPISASKGQIVYQQPYSSSVHFYYSKWSLEDPVSDIQGDISQKTALISGFMPLGDNFEARYYLVTASNNLDIDNIESELAGLGDLRVQFSHSFSRDRLLLSAGFNLPTGKQELDTDGEMRVIEFLSRDYLSFPLRRYGEGLGFNLLAGGATKLGPIKCGITASYHHTGTYEPYISYGDYNPGNIISLGANANFTLNQINYTAQSNYVVSETDKLNESDIYKQAPQLISRLSATYTDQAYRATLGTRVILRGRNTRYSTTDGVIDSQLKKYGDEFDFFFNFDYTNWKNWLVGIHVATRQISSGEEAMDRSSIYDSGLNVSRKFSDNLSFNIGGIYHIGSTDKDDITISGFQTSTSLSVTY
jgi:hypothetical protein